MKEKTISIRLSEKELTEIDLIARRDNINRSNYILKRVLSPKSENINITNLSELFISLINETDHIDMMLKENNYNDIDLKKTYYLLNEILTNIIHAK